MPLCYQSESDTIVNLIDNIIFCYNLSAACSTIWMDIIFFVIYEFYSISCWYVK